METAELTAVLDHLKAKTISFNWLTAAILIIVLMGGVALYIHSERSFDKEMAANQLREDHYNADMKAANTQAAADRATILQLTQQMAQKQTQIIVRDKAADTTIAQVLAPERSTNAVTEDVKNNYHIDALYDEATKTYSFDKPDVQLFVSTKIDRDRLAGDLKDTQDQLKFSVEGSALMSKDLGTCQANEVESKKVIDGYKKAAVKSKFQRFIQVVEKVGLVVGGIYLGSKL